jgi:hypothetical protein
LRFLLRRCGGFQFGLRKGLWIFCISRVSRIRVGVNVGWFVDGGTAVAEDVPATGPGRVGLLAEAGCACGAPYIAAFGGRPKLTVDFGSNVGSNTGRSGLSVVARVSSVTNKPGGRLEKYFCLCRSDQYTFILVT